MAEHQHLPLPRAEVNLERRRRPGFGVRVDRDPAQHGQRLRTMADAVVATNQRRQPPAGIDPSLILRVETDSYTAENDWEAAGLTVLSKTGDNTLVLFSSDSELTEFRRRISAYRAGPPEGRQAPSYAGLISAIRTIGEPTPNDRIGRLWRREGVSSIIDIDDAQEYTVDLELWDIRPTALRQRRIAQIETVVAEGGGEVTDRYTGRSITLLRVVAPGTVIRELLTVSDVRQIDLPPRPDGVTAELLDLGIGDFGELPRLPDDYGQVAVLDSGFNAAHPLIITAAGESIGVPADLGVADLYGHGTRVAGIAVYGNVRACAEARLFEPEVQIHSAKIVTDEGQFHPRMLITSQMRQAITYFSEQHGCKIFNVSLGDRRLIFDGVTVGTWPAVLDELSRDLDVVIVVSAGNLEYRPVNGVEDHLSNYPHYLLEDESRILEPGNASLALTVGSLAHAAAVPPEDFYGVAVQPISQVDGPSPFTRRGPGVAGAIKPDFVDYGGNLTFDGFSQNVRDDYPENSVLCLNSEYLQQLFTNAVGTSYAAPLVAYKAALVARAFPNSSANLIRALLASSASVPAFAKNLMDDINADATSFVCGYGVPDHLKAIFSDDNRVVLYTDGRIDADQFLVYEVPIVEEFSGTRGERTIKVTLAFDPPTRHTRTDYLGNRMSFRMIRGATLDDVIEHFRRRTQDDAPVPDMAGRYNCSMSPGPNARDKSSLQRATFTMRQNPAAEYGDTYFLVVRCESRWSDDTDQRFALSVEIEHRNVEDLYAVVAQRVRQRVRPRVLA